MLRAALAEAGGAAPRTGTPIGQERAVPRHLRDSDVFTLPLPELIRFGERLFAANWTEQDGAGRP